MNRKEEELIWRMKKAEEKIFYQLLYQLHFRLSVTEGIRDMYAEFASRKFDDTRDCHNLIMELANRSDAGSSESSSVEDVEEDSNKIFSLLDGNGDVRDLKREDFRKAEINFRKACRQVYIINRREEELIRRVKKSDEKKFDQMLYQLRFRLSFLKVYVTYAEFASSGNLMRSEIVITRLWDWPIDPTQTTAIPSQSRILMRCQMMTIANEFIS
ncbi:hypothetical protein CHS0354_003323 [Potamilus streckersoni]|uniref:Uncharacterized protein n=1 Tax=Potamilus streckersoni TaxID=2493646 RepID=A0AAE0S5D8_9BIVA|nr:hypothetical protein CHS0354_003323 [Potamilus streckersoni]